MAKRGYTLIELTIILAIMAIFATVSWPVMMRPWQQSQVQRDAETLRELLSEARQTAITNAAAYEFRFKPGTNEYEIRSRDPVIIQPKREPQDTGHNLTDLEPSKRPPQTQNTFSDLVGDSLEPKRELHFLARGRLSEGNIFALDRRRDEVDRLQQNQEPLLDVNLSTYQLSSEELAQDQGRQSQDPHQRNQVFDWAEPVSFQPNGRTSNAEFTLQSDDGFSVVISLRGFTGAISFGHVFETKSNQPDNDKDIAGNEESDSNNVENGLPTNADENIAGGSHD